MVYAWLIILFLTFVLCLKNTALGCCMLIFTRVLIPDVVRLTPYADISLNTGVIGIIFIFMIKDLFSEGNLYFIYKNQYIRSLIVFLFLLLLSVLLGDCLDFPAQLAYLRQFFITDIFPIIAIVLYARKKKESNWLIYAMLIAVYVNTIYGISTVVIGMNPYASALDLMYSTRLEQIQDLYVNVRAGTLSTSSTFSQPNQWGAFLPLAFAFHFYFYKMTKSKWVLFSLILITICVFLCAKRTAILAYLCFWIAYGFIISPSQKMKLVIGVVCVVIVVGITIQYLPQFSGIENLIESSIFFWDDSIRARTDVGGSSMEMRLDQAIYPWQLISDSMVFGKGFGFSHVYINQYGLHPILKGFETILSYAVTNGGVLGCITWAYFFISSLKFKTKNIVYKKYATLLTTTAVVIAVANGLALIIFYGIFVVLLNKVQVIKKYMIIRN